MILEEMYNGRFYPCETVVADSPRFKQAVKASAALMDALSERLSKEDYALVEELREQVAIAQCEENESRFKYGFSAGLLVQQEANQKRLHDLAVMQSRADAQESEVRTFIKEIWRYAAIAELDESVLNRLISKILIGEVKKVDGQKVQEVRIVYNFVGEIPEIAA